MEPKRIGRQTPTTSLVLPYKKTKGKEAVEIYNKTGRTAREWQELLIYDIMAYDDEGLWFILPMDMRYRVVTVKLKM